MNGRRPHKHTHPKVDALKKAISDTLRESPTLVLVRVQVRRADEARRIENEASAQKLADLRAVSKRNSAKRDAEEELERQRLNAGIQADKTEDQKWRKVTASRRARLRRAPALIDGFAPRPLLCAGV